MLLQLRCCAAALWGSEGAREERGWKCKEKYLQHPTTVQASQSCLDVFEPKQHSYLCPSLQWEEEADWLSHFFMPVSYKG